MTTILASPMRSLLLGLLFAVAVVAIWIAASGVDRIGFAAFVLRWIHIASAIVWLGMIWFVNFVQLVALAEADQTERSAIMKLIVPRVTFTFRHASHLAVASGVLLLMATGYMFDRLVYSTEVYIAPMRSLLLWSGTLAAMAMYMFVHMMIWPALRTVLAGPSGDADAIAAARARVAVYARWNLILAVPVTVAMVAAAHLH